MIQILIALALPLLFGLTLWRFYRYSKEYPSHKAWAIFTATVYIIATVLFLTVIVSLSMISDSIDLLEALTQSFLTILFAALSLLCIFGTFFGPQRSST